jgi:hypothetical protein
MGSEAGAVAAGTRRRTSLIVVGGASSNRRSSWELDHTSVENAVLDGLDRAHDRHGEVGRLAIEVGRLKASERRIIAARLEQGIDSVTGEHVGPFEA